MRVLLVLVELELDVVFLLLFDDNLIFLNIDLFFLGEIIVFSIFNDSGISGLEIFHRL